MAVYAIRMVKEGRTLVKRQVSEGMGRSGAVLIKAQAGVSYLLSDAVQTDGQAPAKISFKRIGKDLHLSLAGQNLETPDLIIEGYFDFPAAPISGILANGNVAQYDLGTVTNSIQTPETAATNASQAGVSKNTGVASSLLPGADDGIPTWAWAAGLLFGAVALKGGGGGASTSTQTDTSQTALNKVKAYADDNQQTLPELADYQAMSLTGVTSSNVAAINNAVDALVGTQVDSKVKLQTVIDAYVKILAEANGTSVDATAYNPQVSDYQAIGANIGQAATNSAALNLLNEVVGSLTTTGVDTVAEINALAAVVNKLMDIAAGINPSSALTLADVALIGLPTSGSGAINVGNLNAIVAAIASSGGQTKVDTLPELLSLTGAVATIINYAADNTQATPTVAQYTALGVIGVNTNNLDAFNSAIDAKTASNVDSKAKVQAIVDAYTAILAEANGSAADLTPSSNPTALQYAAIGATIGVASGSAGALALLNDVVGNAASSAVDTISEINALSTAIDKVFNLASGAVSSGLSVADCASLGLPVAGAGAVNSGNIAAINQAIVGAGGFTKVDSFSELSGVVLAQATILNYANDTTLLAPTVAQFNALNYTGVTSLNLAAVNSAIEANGAARVDTKTKLQTIIDAYNIVLAEANGNAGDLTPSVDPSATQYASIGINIGAASSNAVNLGLLNDTVKTLNISAVDTVVEMNTLAAASNAVIAGASGTGASATSPTLSQLTLLGITGITIDNLAVIQNAISATADSGLQVDTIAELQTLASTVIAQASASQSIIVSYANSSTALLPSLSDYDKIAVTGVNASNLNSINSAIDAKTGVEVDTAYEVQNVITAYNTILAEANGVSSDITPNNNPTSDDYQSIGALIGVASGGIAGGSDEHSAALSLLNNGIQGLLSASVDTVIEINTLATIVDKIIRMAMLTTGTSAPADTPTMNQLALLGIDTSLADTAAEQTSIWNAVIASADNGSGVSTILALQAIVNANAH